MIYVHTYIRKSNGINNVRKGVVLFLKQRKVVLVRPAHNSFKHFSSYYINILE